MTATPAPPPILSAGLRAQIESWFISEGVPHFIADYAATTFVLTRAAPVLVAYLAATTMLTARFAWSLEFNALVILAAVLIVTGGWAGLNIVRGRPWRSLPTRVGLPEVLVFLLLPAVPPLLVGFQVGDALIVILESACFLGLVYVATSYGLLTLLRWATRRTLAELGSLGRLLTRALPLLMVFIVFVFIQSDTWQIAYAMGDGGLFAILLLVTALSGAFLVGLLAPEIRRVAEGSGGWTDTLSLAEGTPAAPLCGPLRDAQPVAAPLRWHEWLNIAAMVIFRQGLQILLVTAVVVVVLVLFGALLVPVSLQASWAGGPVDSFVSVDLLGRTISLTSELLTVALILGALSGLYFTVSALSDSAYRSEFFNEADQELHRVLAVRSVYRTAINLVGEA